MSAKLQSNFSLNSDDKTNNAEIKNSSAEYLTVGSQEAEKIALRVSNWSILSNFALTAAKFIAGFMANSAAMISDAVHTASDVLSTLVVIVSIKIAGKKSDSDHQYGHERFESLGSLILALMLLATGLMIGWGGFNKLWNHNEELAIPGSLALYAAILSIVVKEAMYWYTISAAQKIKSTALKADAWHHRSDALSSLGALAGIATARLGFPAGDPIASLLICLCIIKTAWDIGKDSVEKLTDQSCDEQTVEAITRVAANQEGVLAVQELKTRLFGTRVYTDITIMCERNLTLHEAHDIAESVHDAIEEAFPQVKHCNVHVNPN
ncbi:MAG: cation diffusion facilitator family transporter [Candidatus Bruticola sp.]